MSYHPGINPLKNALSGPLVKVSIRLRMVLFCLLPSLLASVAVSAQSQDQRPTRSDILAAVSGSYQNPTCCNDFTLTFADEQRSRSTNGTAPMTPDWDGLKRDTWYFMGAQLVSLAVIYILPESVSGWSDEQKEDFSFSKWKDNVSNPQIDEDDFVINYVLHPYWGAAYYVRARERGYGQLNSFWYSLFLSTFYEAGPESLFEQPSIQDLIVTPVFGAWLGEYFMNVRSDIRDRSAQRGYRSSRDNWLWYLTDPLGLVNIGVDRLFGPKAELSFAPLIGTVGPDSGLGIGWTNRYSRSPVLHQLPLLARQGNRQRQIMTGFKLNISW